MKPKRSQLLKLTMESQGAFKTLKLLVGEPTLKHPNPQELFVHDAANASFPTPKKSCNPAPRLPKN